MNIALAHLLSAAIRRNWELKKKTIYRWEQMSSFQSLFSSKISTFYDKHSFSLSAHCMGDEAFNVWTHSSFHFLQPLNLRNVYSFSRYLNTENLTVKVACWGDKMSGSSLLDNFLTSITWSLSQTHGYPVHIAALSIRVNYFNSADAKIDEILSTTT